MLKRIRTWLNARRPTFDAASLSDLVEHPRFGRTPRPTGARVSEAELRTSFWRLQNEMFFPETAIRADLTRQHPHDLDFPMPWYVDILKTCRDCGRRFIFFAEEQRYWYEQLRFKLDADCVRCPACRKDDQVRRAAFDRYTRSIGAAALGAADLSQLVVDVMLLWHEGMITDAQKVHRVKNMARQRLPDAEETAAIIALCTTI